MKIGMRVSVEIDAEAWQREYGLETREDVREDVKRYIEAALYEMPIAPESVRVR